MNKAVFEQTTVKPEKFPYELRHHQQKRNDQNKGNFFHNRVDPADWTERDLARMTPEAREDYEGFILSDRPKYIPMKPEKLAKLSPEDRQEYEYSLKITKTPRRYALRSRPY